MPLLPRSLRALISLLSKLPGLGPKTAARLAFYFADKPEVDPVVLGKVLLSLGKSIKICSQCHNVAESDPCELCSGSGRDRSLLCVVETPLDLLMIEKSKSYRGLYHVLGGRISPTEGKKPEELTLRSLLSRLRKDKNIREVILATNPTLEGEATAHFLAKLLSPFKFKLTRLGRGLPVGGNLEYTDEVTLARAFEGRREISL